MKINGLSAFITCNEFFAIREKVRTFFDNSKDTAFRYNFGKKKVISVTWDEEIIKSLDYLPFVLCQMLTEDLRIYMNEKYPEILDYKFTIERFSDKRKVNIIFVYSKKANDFHWKLNK